MRARQPKRRRQRMTVLDHLQHQARAAPPAPRSSRCRCRGRSRRSPCRGRGCRGSPRSAAGVSMFDVVRKPGRNSAKPTNITAKIANTIPCWLSRPAPNGDFIGLRSAARAPARARARVDLSCRCCSRRWPPGCWQCSPRSQHVARLASCARCSRCSNGMARSPPSGALSLCRNPTAVLRRHARSCRDSAACNPRAPQASAVSAQLVRPVERARSRKARPTVAVAVAAVQSADPRASEGVTPKRRRKALLK